MGEAEKPHEWLSLEYPRWRHFAAAPDVQVLINEDVPPWRMHALQKALDQFILLANAETPRKGEP